MEKNCTNCKKDKDVTDFRLRHDKRKGNYYYFNNHCKECENEKQKEYYEKAKNNENFKIKNRKRVKKYIEKNIDIVKEKTKKRRLGNKYRENRKQYILKNKDKIYEQEKICKLKYHNKNRDELTDKYIVRLILQKTNLRKEDILNCPKLIEVKRKQIQLIRKINERINLETKN